MKFRVQAQGDRAEILIYDDIGAGFFGGISAKDFADELAGIGDVEEINVRINSPGGSVFDGFAIYNSLKRLDAKIIVDIDGMALSIASVIAMVGDEIRMADNAMMMVHNPFTVVAGTSKELRETADVLDSMRDNIAQTYSERSKLSTDEAITAMDAETWYTAQEAVDVGLADNTTEELKVAAHFDLSRFSHPRAEAISRAQEYCVSVSSLLPQVNPSAQIDSGDEPE